MGYFLKTIKPILSVGTIIQSSKTDLAFAQGDLMWDWHAFDVPKGACKLESATIIVRGNDGSPQTARDLQLWFARGSTNNFDLTKVPGSLGTGNATVNGHDHFNNILGRHLIDVGEFALYHDWINFATSGFGGANQTQPNLVLQGVPESGTNVGYDKLYIAGVTGASNTWNFSTGVLLNDGDDIAAGDTALVTDGTDADKVFSPGDIILKHDSDAVVGTVKSVTANLITLESGSGITITDDDELVHQSPVTVLLGFSN